MSTAERTINAGLRQVSGVRLERFMPLAIFGASLLITCTFLAVLPDRFRVDEGSDYAALYEPVARSILAGRGFTSATGEFAVVYPPGFPLVLADRKSTRLNSSH